MTADFLVYLQVKSECTNPDGTFDYGKRNMLKYWKRVFELKYHRA